jgi:tRNA1Val (adenine37-N6)-methyltransferase
MSNNYFSFKKFTIHQDKCAMKVCTDACLFGAILPTNFNDKIQVLDIGTGTGLLSLMFAQKNQNCMIDAIEIDSDAFEQAKENISLSPFKLNIKAVFSDIKTFQPAYQYNIILSNPPFYINDLKSQDLKRNLALHGTDLSYDELLNDVDRLLINEGVFYVLIPFNNEKLFVDTAAQNALFPQQITRVKQTTEHSFFRSIIRFGRREALVEEKIIVIKNNNQYSNEFVALLKDYYLFL